MQLHVKSAEVFVPDGSPIDAALRRTTHLGVSAHQDDLEIMAYPGIIECFHKPELWFTGVCVTDGAGSPRDGAYRDFTDVQMQLVRRDEQKKAAVIGEYSAMILLDHPSSVVKDPAGPAVAGDLLQVLRATRPPIVFTHNLADKHDTHVAVTLRLLQAVRALGADERPQKVYGCEVWRDLDWLSDSLKTAFDVSAHENLQAALLGVYDSQIAGGKRYDLATMGRRRANATYFATHGVDTATGITFAMDLTPLIAEPAPPEEEYVLRIIEAFRQDVSDRLRRMGGAR